MDKSLNKEQFAKVMTCADRCEEDDSHGGVRFFVADALGRLRRVVTKAVGREGPSPIELIQEIGP